MDLILRISACLVIVASPLFAFSQQNAIYYTRDVRASIQAAEVFMGRQDWELALKQLKHTTRLKGKMAVTYRLLGKVQLELGQFADAAESYAQSFQLDPLVSRAAYFECGEALLAAGQTEKALDSYNRFDAMRNERYANKTKEAASERLFDELLQRRISSCGLWQEVDSQRIPHWPTELEGQVNTRVDEYMPSIDQTGNWLIFTRQESNGDENIYRSRKSEQGKWGYPRPLSEEVHTPLNEGMAKYAPLGHYFLFAGCRRSDSEGSCDVYKSFLNHDDELDIYPLPGQLNSPYWDSQPSVSCDGRSVYFSSLRPGGYGGADIYVSHQLPDGSWGSPRNLGAGVNTPGDEEGPYISRDGTTLFFASDGHTGYGLNDLFISRLEDGTWQGARNLGFPINSAARELGVHLDANNQTIVFASSRGGNMNIWETVLPENFSPAATCQIHGEVFDHSSGEPLSGVSILVKNDEEGTILYTDERGFFSACLPSQRGYSFQIDHPGYEYSVSAEYLGAQGIADMQIALHPLSTARQTHIRERKVQVFFPTDSSEPDPNSLQRLEELVNLLNAHPHWLVEIKGYADTTGSNDYNRELSEARARGIASFLKQHGINAEVISSISGYGTLDESEASRRADIILKGD